MAALAAYVFIEHRSRLLFVVYQLLQKLLLVLPTMLIGLLFFARHYARKHGLEVDIGTSLLFGLLAICQLLSLISLRKAFAAAHRDMLIVAVAAFAFWLTNVLLREPAELQVHAARPFVQAVEALRREKPAPLAFYGIGKDSLAIVYHVNVIGDFRPQFVDQVEQLAQLHYPLYLLISDKARRSLAAAGSADERPEWPQPAYRGFFRDGDYSVYYLEQPPRQRPVAGR